MSDDKKHCYVCGTECSFMYAKDTEHGPICVPCWDQIPEGEGLPQPENLGTCCGCGKEPPGVRNVMFMEREAPPLTDGWGCLVCGLPQKGAIAILCDDCINNDVAPRFVVSGTVTGGGRQDVTQYPIIPFNHDMAKHPEMEEEWRDKFTDPGP